MDARGALARASVITASERISEACAAVKAAADNPKKHYLMQVGCNANHSPLWKSIAPRP